MPYTIADLSKYIPAVLMANLDPSDRKFYLDTLNENGLESFLDLITRLGLAKSSASAAASSGGGGASAATSSGGGGASAATSSGGGGGGASAASSSGGSRCRGKRCGGHGVIARLGCCELCLLAMEADDKAKARAASSPSSGGGGGGGGGGGITAVFPSYAVDRGMYFELPLRGDPDIEIAQARARAEMNAKYGGAPSSTYHNTPCPLGPGVHVINRGVPVINRVVHGLHMVNPGVHGLHMVNPGVHGLRLLPGGHVVVNPNHFNL